MLKLRSILNKMLVENTQEVLSVYLDIDPARLGRNNRSIALIWLKDSIKEIRKSIPSQSLKDFETLEKKILDEVENGELKGKSLIAFLSKDFFEIAYPQVNVVNEIWWGKPSLGQLDWLLEEYRNIGLIKVEAERLRYYVISMNEIIKEWEEHIPQDTLLWETKHLPPEKVLREKAIPGLRGGDTKEIFERHLTEEIQKFWKGSVASLENMSKNYYIKEIILAGLDSQTDLYQKCVHTNQLKIIGNIHVHKDTQINEMILLAQEVFQKYEREREKEIVDEILERSETDTNASLGIKNVLKVLQEGRAKLIALTDCTDKILIECASCGYVMTKDAKECKQCTSKNLRVGSIRTLLPPLLRKFKVSMDIVSSNISEKFSKHGIGALWRY